jgi:putative ABC transport system permease protein
VRLAAGAALALAPWRDQPLRALALAFAVAAGVALASAVHFINATALGEFEQASRRLVGEADLVLRGPARTGFPESLFAELARNPDVEVASPVLELEVALAVDGAARDGAPGDATRRSPLRVLGLDAFRAGAMQPALFAEVGGELLELLEPDAIMLSAAAAERLGLARGDTLEVISGTQLRRLRIIGILSADAYPQALGLMDIASAQWQFGLAGRLNRIDLRLGEGVGAEAFRRRLEPQLPAGVVAVAPAIERARAASATRAYRVNLGMLALVALLTGGFLVFATQSLSILRRRRPLALLRALGMTRGALQRLLLAEGLVIGAAGSLLGVLAGHLVAGLVLARLRGDLGGAQLASAGDATAGQPLAAAGFVALGTAVTAAGAWLAAREAGARPPAAALKPGDAEAALLPLRNARPGLALLALGAVLALLPPLGGLPVAGYASIAALLFGGVLLVPVAAGAALARVPRSGRVAIDLAIAQLRGSLGQASVGLAAVIVSFSLMVAMTIMVHSFRESFERWLGTALPADLQLRAAQGSDTAWLDAAGQRAIAGVPGVMRAEFRRVASLVRDPARAPVTLVARDLPVQPGPESLTLLRRAAPSAGGAAALPPAWISEALVDLRRWAPGDVVALPLGPGVTRFRIEGVFRDYGRSNGTVLLRRDDYRRLTGDTLATEGSLWLARGAAPRDVIAAVRAALPRPEAVELLETSAVRQLSLRIFDRAFLVTYGLEAVAVAIGLLGVAFAAGSTALARRGEFGMLRHVGLRRRQVLAMIGAEGLLTGAIGVAAGLALGGLLSLVLVHVVNRQSFGWSIDFALPALPLAAASLALAGAATLAAMAGGRAALGGDVIRAAREDA